MAKKVDNNGFLICPDTVFIQEGVFEYAGCELDPDGSRWGLDPKRLYKVYRPRSELAKPEFLESLNQKPIVDDHTIIGRGEGMVAPERKNVAGVLSGVEIRGGQLIGRLDIWSTKMQDKINHGKRELSLAYGCEFVQKSGVFKGEKYDFVQSNLKCGNHLALVDEARNGHACRIEDRAFVCDSVFKLEVPDMPTIDWGAMSADELVNGLKGCSDECRAKAKEFLNTPTADEAKAAEEAKKAEEEQKAKDAEAAEAQKKADAEKSEAEKKEAVDAAVAEAEKKAEEEKKEACDKAVEEFKAADALAKDCAPKFGTISMDGIRTERDLAVKVCALDAAPAFLKSVKPEEAIVALKGYLASAGANVEKKATTVVDSAPKSNFADYMRTIQ